MINDLFIKAVSPTVCNTFLEYQQNKRPGKEEEMFKLSKSQHTGADWLTQRWLNLKEIGLGRYSVIHSIVRSMG